MSKTVNGTTTRFLYDGPEILTETNGTGAMQGTYVFGPGLDHPLRMVRGAATHYFHADRLGSIIALSTTAGAVAETFRYDTFGRPATASTLGNRFLFTGREYDPETGLSYYRARYHDPRLGWCWSGRIALLWGILTLYNKHLSPRKLKDDEISRRRASKRL